MASRGAGRHSRVARLRVPARQGVGESVEQSERWRKQLTLARKCLGHPRTLVQANEDDEPPISVPQTGLLKVSKALERPGAFLAQHRRFLMRALDDIRANEFIEFPAERCGQLGLLLGLIETLLWIPAEVVERRCVVSEHDHLHRIANHRHHGFEDVIVVVAIAPRRRDRSIHVFGHIQLVDEPIRKLGDAVAIETENRRGTLGAPTFGVFIRAVGVEERWASIA